MERLRGSGSKEKLLPSQTTTFKALNDNIYEFYKPPGEPTVEILFFHGLQLGHSADAFWSTWTGGDDASKEVWPRTWLAEVFPNAHILSMSYDSCMRKTREQGRLDLHNVAENLLHAIRWAHIGQGFRCPVILIGHSFGGLVIKELCIQADETRSIGPDPETIGRFLQNVAGVFFYGTPHRGSQFADISAHVLDGPLLPFVKLLSVDSARLESTFDAVRKKYKTWRVAGVGESFPTKWGPFHGVLVPEGSARYGDFCMIAADHISLTKPERRTSNSFQHLINFMQRIVLKDLVQGGVCFDNFQQIPKTAVGLDLAVEKLREILQEKVSVGMVGMGGVGKTTLAMAVFNRLAPTFEYSCFVSEVKLIAGSVEDVNKEIWKRMHCRGKKVEVANKDNPWSELKGKRLLLVLDDVADNRDLEVLSYIREEIAGASRSIVTSRDAELLHMNDLDAIYPVPILDYNNAKQLFMSYAFPNGVEPPLALQRHVKVVVKKCDGLPLTLEIIGKNLKQRRNEEAWKQTVEALDKAEAVFRLDERLWEKLKLSYNSLGKKQQQMFLDATTFFGGGTGWTLREAKAAWRVTYGIEDLLWQTLVDMSLVHDVKEDEHIKVHEQLQSLGRKIASDISEDGKCRVWNNSEALKLLSSTNNSDDQELYSLQVRLGFQGPHAMQNPLQDLHIARSCLPRLKKLHYLDIHGRVVIDGDEDNEMTQLVLLRCLGLQFGQLLFNPASLANLAVLKLSCYGIEFLPTSIGQLSSLKIFSILDANHIGSLPGEVGNLLHLERLQFTRCSRLRTVPETFGQLSALQHLEFRSCPKLHTLPESFGQLCSLEHLEFDSCTDLEALPVSFGNLTVLSRLTFNQCENLSALPESFGHLASLKHLELQSTLGLHTLSESFGQLPRLEHLELVYCWNLKNLPESFGQLSALKHLRFERCDDLHTLPMSFGHLSSLRYLEFLQCGSLRTLPESFGKLSTLEHLELHGWSNICTLPQSFGQLSSLRKLGLRELAALDTLPDSFGQLAGLKDLTIAKGNKIDHLSDSLSQLMALRCLIIDSIAIATVPDFIKTLPSLQVLELGSLPYVKGLPQWLGDTCLASPALSRKIFDVKDGHFSLKQEEKLDYEGQHALLEWRHGKAMDKVATSDYKGALAELNSPDLGLLNQVGGAQEFILQEQGIIKRLMGDLGGALEDLTLALEKISEDDRYLSILAFDCRKHRGYVRYLMGDMEGAQDDGKEAMKLISSSKFHLPCLGDKVDQYLNFNFVSESVEESRKLELSAHPIAVIQVRMSDFDGAVATMDKINVMKLATDLQPFFLQERGIMKRFAGDLVGALNDLTAALETTFKDGKDDYECQKHRGYVKYLLKDFDGARTDARRALAIKAPAAKLTAFDQEDEIEVLEAQGVGHRRCLGLDPVEFLEFKLK